MTDDRVDKNTVVIDQETGGNKTAACCFVSEKIVATCGSDGDAAPFSNPFIKYWDVRMLRKEPTTRLVLPSFPSDIIKTADAFKMVEFGKKTAWHAMTKIVLTPIRDSHGSVVLTHFYQNQGVVVDPVSDSSSFFSTDGDVVEVDRALGTVAEYNFGRPSGSHDILRLFEARAKTDGSQAERKRSHDGNQKSEDFALQFKLRGRYECSDFLECLSFNESGTNLIGGTESGGIVVFPGRSE
jgi:hypothetical protein